MRSPSQSPPRHPVLAHLTPASPADTSPLPMRRPTVLADFDGVWIDMRGQAHAVVSGTHQRLASLCHADPESIRADLDRARAVVRSAPQAHGWRIDGRITAWSDEDPFLFHNATMGACDQLAEQGDSGMVRMLEAVRNAGHASLNAFGSAIFSEASHAWLDDHGHDLLPGALEALRALTEVADVVFCTNFASEAVARTWTRHGVTFSPPGTPGPLRLRGGARKQNLTHDPPRDESFAGRNIPVDRGFYRSILLEERPDVVIGDVFSLDLALPIVMKRETPGFERLRTVLMRTPFSCAWSLGLADPPSPTIELADHPCRLVDIAREAARQEVPPC